MRTQDSHLTDQDLLLAADGELTAQQAERVQAHLAHCWACRTKMRELEETIADFVRARGAVMPQLPPADGPRALLKARVAELAALSQPTIWERITAHKQAATVLLSASLAVLTGIVAFLYVRQVHDTGTRLTPSRIVAVPDPQLTPGATLPLTRDDVCAAGMVDAARVVPVDVAKKVFAAYGIDRPEPRAYEVDYLITPALGGSDNIRNFWPQPYGNTIWNAHIKDALEDHLRRLVCEGQLDLATAQHEIAQDWTAAYKKYFRTDRPLSEHATFLKDRPWE